MSHQKRDNPEGGQQNPPSKRQERGNRDEGEEEEGEEQLLEQGHVYIFFREAVHAEGEEDTGDVKRLYFMTVPKEFAEEGGNRPAGRVFALPKKKFPDVDSHERFACFVEATFQSLDDTKKYLQEEHYSTKTRGERVNPKATLVAAGAYGISYKDRTSHFIMSLDESSSEQVEQVWPEFNLRPTASFVMQVKAPGIGGPPGAPSQDADFPQDLRERFGDYRWIPVETTRLLDYDKCQLLLVGAREDIESELGEPARQVERREDRKFTGDASKTSKIAMRELSIKPEDVKLSPLWGGFD